MTLTDRQNDQLSAFYPTKRQFAFKEAKVGLQPGFGLIRGPAVIGRHWTRWLSLTADTIDATKALEIGLVQQVVPHEHLLEEALGIAGRIAANPAVAVQVGKQIVNRETGAGLPETLEATALLFTTSDHKEGVAAFLERREPRFEGR